MGFLRKMTTTKHKFLPTRQDLVRLCKERNYQRGIEIGVRYGWFSRFILENTDMSVVSLDPWEPNIELKSGCQEALELTRDNLKPFGPRATIVKAWSPAGAHQFANGFFDFIYIDGAHDYDSVQADLAAWWPKLASGGIFAGHDYDKDEWPGVYNAVNEFGEEVGKSIEQTGIGDQYGETDGLRSSWWFTKD